MTTRAVRSMSRPFAAAAAARAAGIALAGISLLVAAAPLVAAAAPPTAAKLLLVDDHCILYGAGTHRVFHAATPYAGNPVIGEDRPWETTIAWNSVWRDPKTGRYQMWYQAHAHGATTDVRFHSAVCYAESDDGVVWTKPGLGLFEFNGRRDTNHVLVRDGGYRVPGFTAGEAAVLAGDSLDHRATWKGNKTVADLPPGRYTIRIHLDNAEVFAATIR